MTLKVTQGHWKCAIQQVMVLCISAIMHHFRDITIFTVYMSMTACDLEKSFSFEKTVKLECGPLGQCPTGQSVAWISWLWQMAMSPSDRWTWKSQP